MDIRTENWNGYEIRFVYYNDEWLAVLKDICSALGLHAYKVSQRLEAEWIERVPIDSVSNRPSTYKKDDENSDIPSKYTSKVYRPIYMLCINEIGIYETLFASRKLEARKFRTWAATVMKRLRYYSGLEGYEVMRMTEKEIQDEIDWIFDNVFYNEETEKLMIGYTVQGGDVEVTELDNYLMKHVMKF